MVRFGSYYRSSDSRHIQRFLCKNCGKHFSNATFSACYRQKKRRLNEPIRAQLCSGLSIRRLAMLHGVTRKTIARKLEFLGQQAKDQHRDFLNKYVHMNGRFSVLQFDDLETFEHTKCKPLSVTLVVDAVTRIIIDFTVAQIPAKGRLAAISRSKYGKRKDLSRSARHRLFKRLKAFSHNNAIFKSDQHLHYPQLMKAHFPHATHLRYKSIRGSDTGQGELKKTRFDPLFSINHTLAMLRANINRLVRKTWCTTKKVARLEDHLAIFAHFHNSVLVYPNLPLTPSVIYDN